jgi:hypothetical protein
MLTNLVRQSIRHRGVVIGLAVALVVYGTGVVAGARLDVFPEFAPPQVSIQTEAPGLSPEQVEVLVTKPIEDAINGVEGIAAVRSQSIQGLSVITAVLAERQDIYRARQTLAERLGEAAGRLPATVTPPVLTPLTSSSSTVLVVGVTSASRSLMEQRTFVDWVVRPRLLATPGVSKVAVFGGEVRQLQIQLDPERLRLYGIGIAEVAEAARQATGVRGAGVIDGPNQRVTVRAEGQAVTPAALAETVVRERDGSVLRLADLGRVVEAPEPRVGEGGVDGQRGLVVVVSAQLGANTKVVAQRAEEALARLEPAIRAAGITLRPDIFRPSDHRSRAAQHRHVAPARGGPRGRGPARVPVGCRGRRDIPHGDPTVAARRAHRAGPARVRYQHADAGRARHRARRGGGRREHTRGEHRAAAAGERHAPAERHRRAGGIARGPSSVVYATFWWPWCSSPCHADGGSGRAFRPLGLAYIRDPRVAAGVDGRRR